MNYKQQNSVLMGVTAFFIVASLVLCGFVLQFTHTIRAAQITQAQGAELQQVQIMRQMLFNDLGEYAKRNPDILRILQPAGVAPAKPATK